jgi:hypothetical protein
LRALWLVAGDQDGIGVQPEESHRPPNNLSEIVSLPIQLFKRHRQVRSQAKHKIYIFIPVSARPRFRTQDDLKEHGTVSPGIPATFRRTKDA